MCGFLAYIGNYFDKDRFKNGLSSLDHRGPDSSKIYSQRDFTFGFNRLAIQDLSQESMQPMIDSYGNSIIYNGEVYNFKELRLELENLNYKFKTTGDVEVLMKSILEWGFEKALNKFQGMFSIIYFLKKKNIIYAARDFFGIKPLFYSILPNDQILFASEIKAITKYNNDVKIDYLASLNPIFFSGMSPKGKTMFKNIFSLNPGDLMTINLNNKLIEIKSVFSIENLVDKDLYKEISRMNEKSISEMYHKEIEKSIKMHLISDAKCGVLFSAGLDSSIIAGVISNLGIDVDLFKYENNNYSDKSYTESFLNFSNQNLHEIRNTDAHLIYDLPRLIYHYETINKSEGVALATTCKLSRKNGYKALLTGDCADEIFAGYTTAQDYYTRSFFSNKKWFSYFSNTFSKIVPGFKELFGADLNHFISPYSTEFFETFFDISLYGGDKKIMIDRYRNSYQFINSRKEIFVNAYMMDEIANRLERYLIRADRFGMMESIELRVPYLINSIVKLAMNTPFNKKVALKFNFNSKSFFSNKIILKNVAKKVGLPKKIINRRKIGTIISKKNFENEIKVFKNLSFSNVCSFLKINENKFKESILITKSKSEVQRQIWNFLALEFLIDQFITGNSYINQQEKIKQILHN